VYRELQNVAAAAIAATTIACAGAAERTVTAATTVRTPSGWTASLLVNSLGNRDSFTEEMRVKPSTFVNARLSRNLSKNTRLSLDVFNVFDRRVTDFDYFSAARLSPGPAASDSFLFSPAEPRGFRVKLRTTF
jgi:outer membrane receptor protein involved in Fe transport